MDHFQTDFRSEMWFDRLNFSHCAGAVRLSLLAINPSQEKTWEKSQFGCCGMP